MAGGGDNMLGVVRSLMLSDNLGDVHETMDALCLLIGIPKREGNYLDGWTDEDWRTAGEEPSQP